MASTLFDPIRRNRLLALLDDTLLSRLAADISVVPLNLRDVVIGEGKPVRHAWFPLEGVISVVAAVEGTRRRVEVGTIGNEGMAGLPLFLGRPRAPFECFVQVSGTACRLPAAAFTHAVQSHTQFADVLRRYTQAFLIQAAQGAACNRAHTPLQRCARWLLMTDDRVARETFDLKQEFLAEMLGERRPTVSRAASTLQARGMISYSRGRMAVVDRKRLEETACGCYRVIRDEYDSLLRRR